MNFLIFPRVPKTLIFKPIYVNNNLCHPGQQFRNTALIFSSYFVRS